MSCSRRDVVRWLGGGIGAFAAAPGWGKLVRSPDARAVLQVAHKAGRAAGYSALAGGLEGDDVICIGFSDLDFRTPMQRDTIFRIASITKLVTAAAAMILVDEGRVRLEDPIDRWIPELANRRVVRSLSSPLGDSVPARRRITVHDLLTLQMGLGAVFTDVSSSPVLQRFSKLGISPGANLFPGTEAEFLERLSTLPLAFHPGERWLYHTGLEVAGILVGRASGQGFSEFCRERILEPLGMTDTGFWVPASKQSRVAKVYARASNGKLELQERPFAGTLERPPLMASGGGGLVSTVDDLARFARMILRDGLAGSRRILASSSVRAMRSDQIGVSVKSRSPFYPGFWSAYGWGLGGAVSVRDDYISRRGRFGWWGGTGTTLFMDPQGSRVAVLLSQQMMSAPDDSDVSLAFLRAVFSGSAR